MLREASLGQSAQRASSSIYVCTCDYLLLFIIYLFANKSIYSGGQVSGETQRKGRLGSDMFSVKMELNSRLFPPGLLVSVSPFACVFRKH